jgi:hypothetical protein
VVVGEVVAGDVVAGEVVAGDVVAGEVVAGLVVAGDVVAGLVVAGLGATAAASRVQYVNLCPAPHTCSESPEHIMLHCAASVSCAPPSHWLPQ